MRTLPLLALALATTFTLPAQNQGLVLQNGTVGWVDVPYSPTLTPTGGITVEAWITYDSTTLGTGYRYPTIVRCDPAPNQSSYFLRVEAGNTVSNRILWWVSTPTGNYTLNWFFTAGQLATWTHIAATYDGTALRIFANGAQVAQGVGNGPIVDLGGVLRIGNGDQTIVGGETWNGEIDELRIWPFARSAAAIAATMGLELSAIPGEVSTWNLNGDASDSSGGNSGAASGTAAFAANTLTLQTPPTSGLFGLGYASGCTTASLAAVNSLATIGNSGFGFVGTRAPANGVGFLLLSTQSLPGPFTIFGVDVFVDITAGVLVSASANTLGTAQVGLAIPNNPTLAGSTLTSQFAWLDFGCATSFSASNEILSVLVP